MLNIVLSHHCADIIPDFLDHVISYLSSKLNLVEKLWKLTVVVNPRQKSVVG